MKKTVQVNLGGQAFVLDEDAYEALSNYLNQITKLYNNSPGKDEILHDIEARIAELFSERLGGSRSVISMPDLDYVIQIMGRPEQFEESSEEFESETQGSSKSFREDAKNKRFYRDLDDQVIGGVCSGIAYYVGLDPLWVRLAFAISIGFGGLGIFLYIVLLLVVPEAKTTAEKLHMKGQPIDISGIGRSIEKEISDFGERISREGGPFARRSGKKLARGIDRFLYLLADILRNVFNAVGKILGGVFLLIGVFVVVILISGLVGSADLIHFHSSSLDVYELGDLVFDASEWLMLSITSVLLLVGIPFIALAYGGFALLFPNSRVPYFGLALFGLWFLGIVMAIFSGFGVMKSFSKAEAVIDTIPLQSIGLKHGSITIKLGEDPFNIPLKRAYYANNDFMMKRVGDNILIGNVDVTVLPSTTDQAYMELVRSSRGPGYSEARENAKSIDYLFTNDSNSISFNAYFSFPSENLLRSQEVEVKLYLPEGASIYLDETSKRFIDDIPNATNMYDPEMVGHYWMMEVDGLRCMDCDSDTLVVEEYDHLLQPAVDEVRHAAEVVRREAEELRDMAREQLQGK
ncbi:MAG: PspC domain-containing protein [Flavobacteriales bacterium]